jgi:hypothetical protein
MTPRPWRWLPRGQRPAARSRAWAGAAGSLPLRGGGVINIYVRGLSAYLGREESALPCGLGKQEEFKMGLVKKDDG